jgi:hypothetical protein
MAWMWFEATLGMALMWGLLFSGFGGVVREVVGFMRTGKPHPLDRVFDALFHLPGAAVALGILWGVRLFT